MESLRGAGRAALVAAVALVLGALPVGATTEGPALSLNAWADDSEGRILETNGHLWVRVHPGIGAEVTMPPQRDAVENARPGSSTTVFGGEVEVRRGFQHHRAAGSLAEGTADALSTTEDLFIHLEPLGVTITAESIRSVARTGCGEQSAADAAAGTVVGGLRINGEPVEVLTTPNGPGQSFAAPDGRGYVEVQTLKVDRDDDANRWTTTALLIRAGTMAPLVVTTPDEIPITFEMAFGITSSSVECGA